MRRLFPFIVTLGVTLLGLGWGGAVLSRIFEQEREDALAALSLERHALEQDAALLLRNELHRELVERGAKYVSTDWEDLTLPEHLSSPMLFDEGLYAEPEAGQGLRVVSTHLSALAEAVATQMRQRGLLDAPGRVSPGPLEETMPAELLRPSVETPRWKTAAREIEQRHRLKSILLLAGAGLVLLSLLLVRFTQWRKQRYLDLQSQFISTVSHELRTPLASIRLLGETLGRRVAALPEARDYPARIVQEADGLTFLVENILSFNRLAKGAWELRRSHVAVDEILSALREQSTGQGPLALTVETAGLTLDADPVLLQLVFSNLIRNARSYNTRTPVEVNIQAPRPPLPVLHVSDNGVGIPREQWERVFDEFYRLPASTGTETHGSGLGLTLCRKILRLHGGELRILSSSPEGTTFELSL